MLSPPPPPSVANVAKGSRAPFVIAQIVAFMAIMAIALGGFAWWWSGSLDLAWPYLLGQRLVFLPAEIECGLVPAGEVVERQIRVANLSSKPITLTGAQQSCGCITLNEFPLVVGPRQERRLDLKIGVSPKPGPFEQTIKVFSDDQGSSSVVIRVRATVQ